MSASLVRRFAARQAVASSRRAQWLRHGLALTAVMVGAGGARCGSGPSTNPDEPVADSYEGRAIQTVSRQLRATGLTVDPSTLVTETTSAEQSRADVAAQLELGLRASHILVLWQLRGILEASPPYRSVNALREDAVSARLPDLRVYYATERRSMVFVDADGRDQAGLEAALAGPMVYAYYDQSPGGLAELLYEPKDQLDGIRVRRCLIEGHALLAELFVRRGNIDGVDAATLDTLDPAPVHTHATLTERRCGAGARLLYARYRAGGWSEVLRSVQNPLPSTEQLMHPSKVDQDFPVNVALPDWPEDGYGAEQPFGEATMTYEDVLGEQTIELLLRERGMDPLAAQVAAVGWDGDRLRIYEHADGQRIIVWRSVWDRDLDAEQFATAIAPKGVESRAFRVKRYGRVVDAISTEGPELAERLHGVLAERTGEPNTQPADAASTAAIEARLRG